MGISHYTTSNEKILEFHFLKINVVIPLLEIVYGLLSLVDGNHLCNIEFITRGLRPLVIISILSLVITTTTRNNNPYTFSKSSITSHYIKQRWH